MIRSLSFCAPLIATTLVLAAASLSAQQVAVEEFTLDNGMQFLLVPRSDQPNVVTAGWVARVGSVNERPGITGISHFFEHMMFRGTDKYPKEKYSATLKSIGAAANANTTPTTRLMSLRLLRPLRSVARAAVVARSAAAAAVPGLRRGRFPGALEHVSA